MDYFKLIKEQEGFRLKPYHCSEGALTVGWGRNISAKGLPEFIQTHLDKFGSITLEMAEILLAQDIADAMNDAKKLFKTFDKLNLPRQAVVVSLSFQLGYSKLAKFKKLIAAVDRGDWQSADKEILNSNLAKQTPNRAKQNANIMQRGQW